MSVLKFNLETLNKMKDSCTDSKQELNNTLKDLDDALAQLKKDWNTPAGQKFFQEHTMDWKKQVDSYNNIVDAMIELLNIAIREYGNVKQEADGLSIGDNP